MKTESKEHPAAQPEAGKALVYLVEDDSEFFSIPKPTTRAGLDGAWVGATHGDSYFYFSVDPGEHHLCASWQTAVALFQKRQTAAAHLTAKAGKVYYFSVRNMPERMALFSLDPDEGQLLASKFSLSTFHPK